MGDNIKPILRFQEMPEKLEELGIQFNLTSKTEAMNILKNSNYYFKIASFRKNYEKDSNGKYNIEFKHLQDLAVLDMRLRYVLLHYCLDIEHAIKTFLLRIVTNNPAEDGYSVVQSVINLQDNPEEFKNSLFSSVRYTKNGKVHFQDGFEKYYNNPPIWVVLEIISIGKLRHFVTYLLKLRPNNKDLAKINIYIDQVNKIRNICAHNKPLLFNLKNHHIIPKNIFSNIKRKGIPNNLSQSFRVAQIFSILELHSLLCSEGMIKHRYADFKSFVERFNSTQEFYSNNNHISFFLSAMNKFVDLYKTE